MPSPVPFARTTPYYEEVQISAAVRGRLWRDLGLLYHWLRGHGMHLIPAHAPRVKLTAGGSRTLRYRVHPSGRAIARVWQVVVRSDGTAPLASYSVTYPDAVTLTDTADYGERVVGEGARDQKHLELLGAKSAALTELAITVTHVDGEDAWIESVSCYELPRAVLTQDATDLGIDLESLTSGRPIYDDGAGNRSLGALARNLAATECRRSLLQYAHQRVSVAAGPVALYSLPIPILPRKVGRSDTTRLLACHLYARASTVGAAGTITVATSGAGDSIVLALDGAVDGTAFAWHDLGALEAICDDPQTPDGLPGGVWETVQVTIENTAGTGAIELESESIWEAP